MALAALLITAGAVLLTLLLWILYPSKRQKIIDRIPGPDALPLIGNAHMFKPGGADFYGQILEFCFEYQKHGILRAWIGPRPSIAVYHAHTVEALLNSSRHMTKSPEYDFLHPWLGTGLLTSTGDKWRVRRKLLTPSFHFKILKDFLQVFNEQSQIMVRRLNEKAGTGEFDLFPYVTLCALDIICDTAMGAHVSAQKNTDSDYVKAVYKISELVHIRQKSPWLWPDLVYDIIGSGKEHKECLKILHGFTRKVIKERSEEYDKKLADHHGDFSIENMDDDIRMITGKRKRLAFLDMLLYAARGDAQLSFRDIQEEVDTFMFEGHDTTAAGINWATHLIGANPDVQEKLHEEMDSIFGDDKDREVTMEDIKEMKYLECCIKEALRIFPSVPMFARRISEDCVIGGYEVPKGTTGIIVTSALHRDPVYFPDPERYDPDRWLIDNSMKRHPFSYVPFSAGLRNCIGQKFAMNEEKVVLSSILRNFNIESLQKREDLRPMGELILRPENGIRVKLTKRVH